MLMTTVSEIINIAQLKSIMPISTDKTVSMDFNNDESFETEKIPDKIILTANPKRQSNSSQIIGKKKSRQTITP